MIRNETTGLGRVLPLALWMALVSAGVAGADDADPTRRVSFQVEASREVSNDWLQATVGVNDEDVDPAVLADRVNRTMAWALEKGRGREGVKVETGGYHTSPVIEKGRTRRWRASQTLRIEGADFKAATKLIGELQERLQLQGLHFSVSPKLRRKTENGLIEEVLEAFEKRAKLVSEKLGSKGYEIVRIDLQTGGGIPRPMRHDMRAMAMSEKAAPAVEGGASRVTVGAGATIELE